MSTALFIFIFASWCRTSLIITIVLAIGTNSKDTEKLTSYECGYEPFSDAREKFDVNFYLIALLFLVFDIEVAFLFPWSVLILEGSKALIWLILAFSFILIAGFGIEMKLGVLDWKIKFKSGSMLFACASINTKLNKFLKHVIL
jgi:NADH:ubiquinone oxidoreductase subunit 3 (subunit A)